MRWLIVLPFARPGLMGTDFGDELRELGHEVRLFAYRRDNPLYKNTPTKAAYQLWILRRLERVCLRYRPDVVLVIKGGPITPGLVRRIKARLDVVFVNFFPDNPLWMIPFECIEAYDVFFTKERYAMRSLQAVGLRNLHYLPMYCVPGLHHPVTPDARGGRALRRGGLARRQPLRLPRAARARAGRLPAPRVGRRLVAARRIRPYARRVAGGPVFGHDKLCVYAASTLSLNPHHPMNDIVGVNTRAFELAAAGSCQVADFKEDLATLFKPGEEVLVYRDLGELKRTLDFHLAHPDEARAIGENARRRALAEHTLRHRVEEMLQLVA